MAQYGFGSGVLFGVRTDIGTATPVQFGALQDVSVDIQFNIKELYGQSQFPLAVARSTAKITGKAKLARIIGRSFNDLFFGQSMTAGQTLMAFQEAGAVPAATPCTVTVANAAGFIGDFGVTNATNGLALVKVAGAPATGQYAVDAGVYTFAAADANLGVLLNYSYAPTVNTAGQTITIANQLIGSAPQFKCVLNGNYQQKQFSLTLNACIANKLQIATKIEDFTIPELDFSAFADAAGNVGSISFAEAS